MVSCDHSKGYEPPTIYFQLETYACPRHLSKGGMDNNIRYKLRIIFWMFIVNFELLFSIVYYRQWLSLMQGKMMTIILTTNK